MTNENIELLKRQGYNFDSRFPKDVMIANRADLHATKYTCIIDTTDNELEVVLEFTKRGCRVWEVYEDENNLVNNIRNYENRLLRSCWNGNFVQPIRDSKAEDWV